MAPKDPRMIKTLEAIQQPPNQGGLVFSSLVYRYNAEQASDGLDGQEGTFNLCSFWLVEALTRAGRTDAKRLDEARLLFEEMLSYANHLGLYAEETGSSGEAPGQLSPGVYPPISNQCGMEFNTEPLKGMIKESL